MSISIPVSAGGPPAGVYLVKFVSVEMTTHEKYGPGMRTRSIRFGPHRRIAIRDSRSSE